MKFQYIFKFVFASFIGFDVLNFEIYENGGFNNE